MRQYMAIKQQHPDCVLFFRMGDFYEMFFEDAKTASKTMNIALTSRSKEKNEPMCGIPYHALATYLARMVRGGHKVAICEQVEDPKTAKGLVKREVVRIVTPGTLTEDYLLDEKTPNYLASVSENGGSLGLACVDLSTGSFTAMELTGEKRYDRLVDEITRLAPKEIIVSEEPDSAPLLSALKKSDFGCEQVDMLYFAPEEAERTLCGKFSVATLEGFGIAGRESVITSAGAAVSYIKKNSPNGLDALSPVKLLQNDGYMEIDSASVRNLELVSNMLDGTRVGTLLEVMDRTKTAMGGRLLRERLVKPLTDREAILKRQSLVTSFFENPPALENIRKILGETPDFERAAGRIGGRNFNPRDFSALAGGLALLPEIRRRAEEPGGEAVLELLAEWDNLEDISDILEKGVNPNHPPTFRENGFIRDGFNGELDEINSFRRNVADTIKNMEEEERRKTGITSLKFGYNRIYGYYIEITKKHAEKIPEGYIRKQSLVNCERYVSPALKELEEKLAGADEKIKEIENRLVEELRTAVVEHFSGIRRAAGLVARLDVGTALADVALTNDYCRPEVTDKRELWLESSRHPVLERLMVEESFVPNDIKIDEKSAHFLIITGPNMAGKSTYLRQVALAVLMAQTGSYVPADSARIGIADRIFTRVGAHDRLQKGLSTFMVEMVETANILNNATEKSFVILDEIGRGTSTFDGISIAWAVAERLAELKCRTLFATHYHELTDLEATLDGVANFNVAAREYRDRLIFMRRLETGPADKSYGIQVGRLAGLPKEVLSTARRVLAELEKMEFGPDGKPALKAHRKPVDDSQFSLFDARRHPALETLAELDPNSITPIEGLALLKKLKDMLE